MTWIEWRRGESIPKELLYQGCQTDKNNWCRTPLMLWIENRPEEAIPWELLYQGC